MPVGKPIKTLPTIIQWNVNSLRPRLANLRRRLLLTQIDVLALQETYVTPGSQRISPYVQYNSHSPHTDGKSRASLLIKRHIHQNEINLKDLNTEYDEHVAAEIRIADKNVTIISSYIRPNQPWDPVTMRNIRARCPGPLIWCGDFNANHLAWGSDDCTPRGTTLLDMIRELGLRCLNSGNPTYVRAHLSKVSVLDLTFVSPEIKMVWDTEPDTWGSDHLPIRLTPQASIPPKKRTHSVINWDEYRIALTTILTSPNAPSLEEAIELSMKKATTLVCLPINKPVPDLTYLKIRSLARRAQRIARRTDSPKDWTASRKFEAILRRHTVRLGRQQWQLRSESLNTEAGSRQPWTTVKSLLSPVSPTSPLRQ